jgi:hypothetical protein
LQVNYFASIDGEPINRMEISYCQPGDADCDGDTDLADFVAFADCLSGPDGVVNPTPPLSPQACLDAFDTDADLDVDLYDFRSFQNVFAGGD